AVGVAVLIALVPIGRYERRRSNDEQLRGIALAWKLAGGRPDSGRLAGYRLTAAADCLLYRLGQDPYALELCFDADGRLFEAIDRRDRAKPRIRSVRYER